MSNTNLHFFFFFFFVRVGEGLEVKKMFQKIFI